MSDHTVTAEGRTVTAEGRTVTVSRCFDGYKTCPFFSWGRLRPDSEPHAQCGGLPEGYLCWRPKDLVRVKPSPDCPLRTGAVTVTLVREET